MSLWNEWVKSSRDETRRDEMTWGVKYSAGECVSVSVCLLMTTIKPLPLASLSVHSSELRKYLLLNQLDSSVHEPNVEISILFKRRELSILLGFLLLSLEISGPAHMARLLSTLSSRSSCLWALIYARLIYEEINQTISLFLSRAIKINWGVNQIRLSILIRYSIVFWDGTGRRGVETWCQDWEIDGW